MYQSDQNCPLQLVTNTDYSEKIKDGVQRNIPQQPSQRICMKIFFSDRWNILSLDREQDSE